MTSAPRATPTNDLPSSRTSAATVFSAGNDHRLVDAVFFGNQNVDPFRIRRGHVLADVVRADGQLAMASVDQHRQLDRAWSSEIHQCIHRRARCAAVVDDTVDQNDYLPLDVAPSLGPSRR